MFNRVLNMPPSPTLPPPPKKNKNKKTKKTDISASTFKKLLESVMYVKYDINKQQKHFTAFLIKIFDF